MAKEATRENKQGRPKTPAGFEAERLCKLHPDTPSKTIARQLSRSHKMTLNAAELCVRRARGNQGKRARAYATSPRPNQPSGWKPQMPPSLAEPWEPFDLGNSIRVAVLSDVHIPYHSNIALASAVRYAKKRKPNVLYINGDFADFYSISRHQKDPSKRDFPHEMQLVREGLAWLRSEFGKQCRIVFKLGNHEERWQHYLWNNAPEISSDPRMDIKEWIDAEKWGVEVVGDQRPVLMGKLPGLHGHEFGKQQTSAVNPARGLFLKTMSTMIIGHGHRTSHHVQTDWRHKQTSCWSTACLCNLNPEYARVNSWNNGAANVEVDSAGDFDVDNYRISPDGDIWK